MMKTKNMYKKSLISVLIVLMIVSTISVLADVDLIVTVVGSPIANAGGPYSGYSGRTIYFDGSGSSDVDGTIVAYDWDFGDGKIGSGIKPSHAYSSTGTYTVNLTVTDNSSLTGSAITTATITKKSSPPPYYPPVNKLPTADAGPDQIVSPWQTVNFSGVDSTDIDGTIISYEWDFGDGKTATGVNVSHIYESKKTSMVFDVIMTVEICGHTEEHGIYSCSNTTVCDLEIEDYIVTLTVTDDEYREDTDTCIVTVREPGIPIPPLPPFLSNLNITPAELELGDEVTISLDIMNPNNKSIFYILTMEVGELTLLIDVDLEGNESKLVSQTITPSLVGVYDVSVDGMTGSFMVKPVFVPPKPAEFVISSLTIIPEEIVEGEMVNVTIVIINIGDEDGNFSSEVVVLDGEYSTEFTIELLGGETTTITFDYLVEIIGTHTIKIDNLTASFTVLPHPLKPAEFLWANFTCPSEVQEGEPLEVSFDVINTGEVAGDAVVTMRIKEIDLSHVMGVLLEPQGGSTQHWISFHSFSIRSYTIQVVGSSGVVYFEDTFNVVPKPIPIWERVWFYPVVALVFVMIGAIGIYIYYRKTDFSGWT